jgi:outer membrane protein G
MKKLALLLAALGIMSASAYAQNSELRITHVGQEIEIENDSGGSNIGESVYFDTNVGLAYKDYTFGIIGAKRWNMDTEDVDSVTGRLVLDAWKNYDNYKVGFRLRSEKDYDRYYARLNYSKGMFWSNWDVWYETKTGKDIKGNDKNDTWRGEVYPLGFQYNGFRIAWFIDAEIVNGSVKEGYREQNFEHQIRAYAPLYKGEKLTLTTQIRYTLTVDDKFNNEKESSDSRYEDFGRTRVYLESNYQVNDSLNVYLKYGYEFRDKEYVKDGKSDERTNYYGDLIAGWRYKF